MESSSTRNSNNRRVCYFLKILDQYKTNDWHTHSQFLRATGKKLQRQLKDYLSDFKQWKEKSHAKDSPIFI